MLAIEKYFRMKLNLIALTYVGLIAAAIIFKQG